MPRFARTLLVASLVALHATVMLCGPCLHRLPGWGHGAGLSQATHSDHVGDPVKATHLRPDDCPVCHFLSQAQLLVDPAQDLLVRRVVVLNVPIAIAPVTPSQPCPTSPRAPPAVPAGLS